ncbi:hypothetical protein AKJ09_09787 [Labilithrix luteola]|uniref:Glycosyltransferase RgtA/B/C/D-like domain-containing protein n=1 Tax=Labilithrix luteola TaxID=1391654 RepID=A0A0K1QBK0_9BACT|nr:hypothetical protein [Labilithrix luteola]AKV03124.1 hypothetical protein AKJ09_09787 [Labilithrix luteola]
MIFAVGVLAFLPALFTPFFLDDHLHAAMVAGTFPVPRSPFDLYDFIGDDNRALFFERGLLPWWAHPNLTIRFFRPLSSALLWLDHRVLTVHVLPMHVHSFVWWALAVLAARALFKRTFSPRVTGLATAIFALAPCHALPLAWLANREALVSLAFGAVATASYASFRQGRSLRDALVAALGFAFALLGGGEYALCFGGYVVAIELVRREGFGRRASGLLPFVLPAFAYLAVRSSLHYGTKGSGFYSDPLSDPGAFLRAVPWRAVALVGDGWFSLGASSSLVGWERAVIVMVTLVATLLAYRPIRDAIRALPEDTARTATWMLFGSLFALTPVLAVVPAARLLGVSMLGISAVVALVLDRAWFGEELPASSSRKALVQRQIAGLVAAGLGFGHLVHDPVTSWLATHNLRRDTTEFARRTHDLRNFVGDLDTANVGTIRGMTGTFFAPFALDPRGVTPRRWVWLSHAGHVLLKRVDEKTLDLIVGEGRTIYPKGDDNLFRDERSKLQPGDEIVRKGMRATVRDVSADGPRVVRFVFDENPEAVTWFADGAEESRQATLPQIGFGKPFDP